MYREPPPTPTFTSSDAREYIEVRNELDHAIRVNIVRTKTRGQIYIYIDKPVEGDLVPRIDYRTIEVKETDY
jgi:hypothetical protein